MTAFARRMLRAEFLAADMGISGVNFAVAESGSLCLVENEGNGRLSTTVPRLHVALMGIERIVPTAADLAVSLRVLARSGTGQALTVYTNVITGPRRAGDPDGPVRVPRRARGQRPLEHAADRARGDPRTASAAARA